VKIAADFDDLPDELAETGRPDLVTLRVDIRHSDTGLGPVWKWRPERRGNISRPSSKIGLG
jgi:hypothetical protein